MTKHNNDTDKRVSSDIRNIIINNNQIIYKNNNKKLLQILEAITINFFFKYYK